MPYIQYLKSNTSHIKNQQPNSTLLAKSEVCRGSLTKDQTNEVDYNRSG
jgi:hypothetical protein